MAGWWLTAWPKPLTLPAILPSAPASLLEPPASGASSSPQPHLSLSQHWPY